MKRRKREKEEEEGNEMMPDLKLRLTAEKSRSREEVMREEEKQMMATIL